MEMEMGSHLFDMRRLLLYFLKSAMPTSPPFSSFRHPRQKKKKKKTPLSYTIQNQLFERI